LANHELIEYLKKIGWKPTRDQANQMRGGVGEKSQKKAWKKEKRQAFGDLSSSATKKFSDAA